MLLLTLLEVSNTTLFFDRYTCQLESFKNSLKICEFYPEKNPHESKIKREYGNKAYQNGKDLDALFLYTQVAYVCNFAFAYVRSQNLEYQSTSS